MSSGKPQFATYQNYMYGLKGFDLLTDATDTSGSWYRIHTFSGSCEFSATTPSGSNFTQAVVPENTKIDGWFSIINVSTGSLLAYRQ